LTEVSRAATPSDIASTPTLSLRRRLLFAGATVAVSFCLALATLLALDVYVHARFEKGVLVNVWGYRGPTAGRKQPGEYRIAVLGGSAAFGYGVRWDESMPAVLERELARAPGRYRVVNLAYNNEGAYSFTFTLKDYAYLKYDLVCLYEGYNDLTGDDAVNRSVFRHDSPVFTLTGYLPIFPLVFREKASVMVYGDTRGVYSALNKAVFRPPASLAARTTAEALRAAASVGESLERQFARLNAGRRSTSSVSPGVDCAFPWASYCGSVRAAVEWALQQNKQVLVVTQPYELGAELRARHRDQQRAMEAMITRRFGGEPRVRYVDLGNVVDLADPALSYDRMHLTESGNERIAAAFVAPVLDMAAKVRARAN
jgi:hypothetical protein